MTGMDGMTCYDAVPTLRATGQSMAAADGYVAQDISWKEIHWDFQARRVIETAYQEACAEKNNPDMIEAWAECGRRMAASFLRGEK